MRSIVAILLYAHCEVFKRSWKHVVIEKPNHAEAQTTANLVVQTVDILSRQQGLCCPVETEAEHSASGIEAANSHALCALYECSLNVLRQMLWRQDRCLVFCTNEALNTNILVDRTPHTCKAALSEEYGRISGLKLLQAENCCLAAMAALTESFPMNLPVMLSSDCNAGYDLKAYALSKAARAICY